MKGTLSRMQKDLVTILSVLCVMLLLFASIGYATLNKEIANLKATNDYQARELENQYSTISSLKYSVDFLKDDVSELNLRKPLQDHSNYHLLHEVAAENQKLTKLKNEHDVMYTWDELSTKSTTKRAKTNIYPPSKRPFPPTKI